MAVATNSTRSILPGQKFAVITPADAVDLTNNTRSIYVGVSGNLTFMPENGSSTILLTNLMAGTFHPICARQIYATGTTCTGIVALI